MSKKNLLEEKTKKQSDRIPLVLTNNRTLPNVKKAITNNRNLHYLNQESLSKKKKLDFPLRVSQNRETYTVSKFYARNFLKAV